MRQNPRYFFVGLLRRYVSCKCEVDNDVKILVMPQSKNISAHLALLCCNIIWACDFPFYALVLGTYISPMAMVTASIVVAALLSLLPLLWESPERVEPQDRLKIIAAALLIGVGRKLCMMYGLAETSPIDGSIVSTTAPLLVLLLSAVVGWERITKIKILGLLLGMAGAMAVILSSNGDAHTRSGMVGNILIFLSACISAVYMVCFKATLRKYRVTTVMRWVYCTSLFVMLPIGVDDVVKIDIAAMTPHILLAALFVLVVPTYLPNLLQNYSLRHLPPTLSSIYAYIQPVVAIALSVAMGIDVLHWDTLLYALLIFVGVWLVVRSYKSEPASAPHIDVR